MANAAGILPAPNRTASAMTRIHEVAMTAQPEQAIDAHRAGALAEQLLHGPLVRRHLENAIQHEDGDEDHREPADDARQVLIRCGSEQQRDAGCKQQ